MFSAAFVCSSALFPLPLNICIYKRTLCGEVVGCWSVLEISTELRHCQAIPRIGGRFSNRYTQKLISGTRHFLDFCVVLWVINFLWPLLPLPPLFYWSPLFFGPFPHPPPLHPQKISPLPDLLQSPHFSQLFTVLVLTSSLVALFIFHSSSSLLYHCPPPCATSSFCSFPAIYFANKPSQICSPVSLHPPPPLRQHIDYISLSRPWRS